MAEIIVSTRETTHEKINGQDYKNLIISAACELEKSKAEINDLNVFPVPDGDTGSNMSMTVGNAARELLNDDSSSVDAVAEKTARAMLRGARGNSGVIVSLLFRGIAKALENFSECDGVAWAEALNEGVCAAYSAVEHPAEGTILTVAKRCAEAAKEAAEIKNDFEFVLSVAIAAVEEALEETIYENPVLEKAGVVDAGGMGWLVVMKAMRHALTGQPLDIPFNAAEPLRKNGFSAFESEDITFAYCTEFIVKKYINTDTSPLKAYLNEMGDSLVMIDDGEIVKVHIHTNNPHGVLGEALKYGEYETVKVENMRTQHTSKITEENQALKNKKYGFVAVVSGEGLKEMLSGLGVDKIVSGGQTMNPSCEEIYKAAEEISADTVFLLPNNKNVIMACEQVKEMSRKSIVVIPTKTVPQGINAMLGFNEELTTDENVRSMTEMAGEVSTIQITYAVRSTVIEGIDVKEGEYIALYEKELLASENRLEGILDEISSKIKQMGKRAVSIYYGADVTKEEAEKLLTYLENQLCESVEEINLYQGGQPVYYYTISVE